LVLAPTAVTKLRDTYTIDAALPSLTLCVSEASLMHVTRILASWTRNRETQSSYHGEEALVKGCVLVKGVESQSGWCWRWLTLKRSGVELFREEDEIVLDEMVRLDSVQASSEHHKGVWVIALQQLHDDKRDETPLWIYAASQHTSLLSSIWQVRHSEKPAQKSALQSL